MSKLSAAQLRALKWVFAHGPATLDRYGNAIGQDGAKCPAAAQTFVRLFVAGLVGTHARAPGIYPTRQGDEALRQ